MTPKEKSIELIDKFYSISSFFSDLEDAKQCALVAVDELLFLAQWTDESIYKYWQEVKQEINKI